MRSQGSRVTAAAVFILAITGVTVWFLGSGAALAQADFLDSILEAKTVRYKVTNQWTSRSGYIGMLPAEIQKEFLKGTTDAVMMLGADRIRTESTQPGKHKTVHIWDGRLGKSISLLPDQKRATISKKGEKSRDKTPSRAPQDAAARFRRLLLDARDKPGVKRESLGETEIDGHRVVGVRITHSDGLEMSVWGDPKTGLPVRIETTTAVVPNLKSTMSDFEFNVELDESLFSVEPPAGYEIGVFFIGHPVIDPASTEEKDLVETFREYSRLSGGLFPATLNLEAITMIVYAQFGQERLQKPGAEQELSETQTKLQRGLTFSVLLPKEADAHYAGKGVSLGAADRPIFWYRPKDAKAYRVIYADLSVREADTPPSMPAAMPEQDLIDLFRYSSQLNGGSFPNKLDLLSLILLAGFPPEEKTAEVQAKHRRNLAEVQVKCQPGLSFVGSLPPEADVHYAGRGVSLGAVDRPIFWYRPQDSTKYRVIFADLSVRDADTSPSVPIAPPEQDLIDMLRFYTEWSDGAFPAKLEMEPLCFAISAKLCMKYPPEDGQQINSKHLQEMKNATLKFLPGWTFLGSLPAEADVHYAGRGISLGTVDRPIFWYRPKDSRTYRVIFADLSIRDADTPPSALIAPPEQDLIDMLRFYTELSGGPFPDSLDRIAISEVLTKKLGLEKEHKPNAKQTQQIIEISLKCEPCWNFVDSLPPDANTHYAGKDISLGAVGRPILWYRPKDSKTYRVVYADLSVRDADAPSNVATAQPVSGPSSSTE